MRMIISALVIFLVFGSNASFADERKEYYSKKNLPPKLLEEISKNECQPNLIGFDVCEKIKEVADNLAPLLPMKMNSRISLDRVMALQEMLILTAILSYDEDYLKSEVQKGGITMEELLDNLKKATVKLVCQPKSAASALIRLGAQVQYQYYFRDMAPYAVIDIDRAACQLKDR